MIGPTGAVVFYSLHFEIEIAGGGWPIAAVMTIKDGGYFVELYDGETLGSPIYATRRLSLETAWLVMLWTAQVKWLRESTLEDIVWLVTRGSGLDAICMQRLRRIAAGFEGKDEDQLIPENWRRAREWPETAIREKVLADLSENSDMAAFLGRFWERPCESPPLEVSTLTANARPVASPSRLARSFDRALQFVGVR